MIASEEDEVNTTQERSPERLERFENFTEIPLFVLALLMVPILLGPVALDLSPRVERVLLTLDWLIWGVFAAELLVRLYLAPARRAYLVSHWFDVLIVVLPFLRALRSARALQLLRAARVLAYLFRGSHTARAILARQGVQGLLVIGLAALVVAAVAAAIAERGADGPIDGFDTAVWWAFTTVTTVGYGDAYPVTAIGRGVATVLMLVGVGLFGLLTANVAAHFVESDTQDEAGDTAATLDAVLAELRRLHERLDAAGIGERGSTTRDA